MQTQSTNLWLAHSQVRARIDNLSREAEFCPWSICPHLHGEGSPLFNKFTPSDGHYGVFDYLYLAVGLRSNHDDEGPLQDALEDFDKAAFAFMNSDEETGSFTFKPEHGGATYYFRKFDGEPSEL
jgi:hypothetical protein